MDDLNDLKDLNDSMGGNSKNLDNSYDRKNGNVSNNLNYSMIVII